MKCYQTLMCLVIVAAEEKMCGNSNTAAAFPLFFFFFPSSCFYLFYTFLLSFTSRLALLSRLHSFLPFFYVLSSHLRFTPVCFHNHLCILFPFSRHHLLSPRFDFHSVLHLPSSLHPFSLLIILCVKFLLKWIICGHDGLWQPSSVGRRRAARVSLISVQCFMKYVSNRLNVHKHRHLHDHPPFTVTYDQQ